MLISSATVQNCDIGSKGFMTNPQSFSSCSSPAVIWMKFRSTQPTDIYNSFLTALLLTDISTPIIQSCPLLPGALLYQLGPLHTALFLLVPRFLLHSRQSLHSHPGQGLCVLARSETASKKGSSFVLVHLGPFFICLPWKRQMCKRRSHLYWHGSRTH